MRQLVCALGIVTALIASPALASAQSKSSSNKSATKTVVTAPVNLNTATAAQLESLPGVGPAGAKRILEYRQKNGSFKKIEELMNVKGFGEKSFLKLKPYITVGIGDK